MAEKQKIPTTLYGDFMTFFTGRKTAYGQHQYGKVEKGKKEDPETSKSWTVTDDLPPKKYKEHLDGNGGLGLGIAPIDSDNNVHFAVIDVDVYNRSLEYIIEKIKELNLPLLPFRSKSGGLHLYLFVVQPIPAILARKYLGIFVRMLGLPKDTEVIPKQEKLTKTQIGSWINLPYYGGLESKQYLYDRDMKEVKLSRALDVIKRSRKTQEELEKYFENLEYSDGPPCLQILHLSGDVENNRNNYLFNMAIYFKAKYDDETTWSGKLVEENLNLKSPLHIDELQRTIIQSHKKKNYAYKCLEEPICSICNKEECKTRKFGVGQGLISDLTYEELIKYNSEPPSYDWKVNTHMLHFNDEGEIINQEKFRQLAMRELHILPFKLSQEVWTKIINTSLQNIQVVEVNTEEDISAGAQLRNLVTQFLIKRASAVKPEQIKMGRAYRRANQRTKGLEFVFKLQALKDFIYKTNDFREIRASELGVYLKKWGMESTSIQSSDNQNIRAVKLPVEVVGDAINDIQEDGNIVDFEQYDEQAF